MRISGYSAELSDRHRNPMILLGSIRAVDASQSGLSCLAGRFRPLLEYEQIGSGAADLADSAISFRVAFPVSTVIRAGRARYARNGETYPTPASTARSWLSAPNCSGMPLCERHHGICVAKQSGETRTANVRGTYPNQPSRAPRGIHCSDERPPEGVNGISPNSGLADEPCYMCVAHKTLASEQQAQNAEAERVHSLLGAVQMLAIRIT